MQWIIKLQNPDKYVYSARIFVSNPMLAKRFPDEQSAFEFLKIPKFANLEAFPVAYEEKPE